jgi:hypothetical protein
VYRPGVNPFLPELLKAYRQAWDYYWAWRKYVELGGSVKEAREKGKEARAELERIRELVRKYAPDRLKPNPCPGKDGW